jgi:beta-galactosidase
VNDSWERGTWPPPFLLYGGDYNPEQWPGEVWLEDVALMREAGVNFVTVGVFSWSMLEPRPGMFDFGWLREVLDLLQEAGIYADLATPTAAAPPWLTHGYPEVLPVTATGVRLQPGSRQTFCVNAPAYRRFASRIVTELARELGGHPAVRAWHVHNEYACHLPACYCDHCAAAFRGWLAGRHGSIDAVNDAWGTAFWSQRYSEFAEITPPRQSSTQNNPGQVLDYRRFVSDAYLAEFREERDILRSVAPGLPVTTNFMGFFEPVDYFAWAPELDFCAVDSYPDPADPDAAAVQALVFDLTRSLRPDQRWMLMEQSASRVIGRPANVPKAPGQMRLHSLQALARGADGICFFQWRASRAGAESFHGAMLPHTGTAAPSWRDVVSLGAELKSLGELAGTQVRARHAIAFSWDSWWALGQFGQPSPRLNAVEQAIWMHRPLFEAGETADFVHPGGDLSRYEMLLIPSLHLLTEAEGRNIVTFIEAGGTAVIAFWTGIVDERYRVHPGTYGGPLRPAIGGDVVDVAPLPYPDGTVTLAWADGRAPTAATHWMDVIEPGDGEVLASYADGPLAGRPAILATRLGAGRALYLGTRIDRDSLAALLGCGQPTAMERVIRHSNEARYEFLLNHSGADAVVQATGDGTDLLTGRAAAGSVSVPAGGAAIIRSACVW